ncbi:MAG: LuxR C-terminal-related transcriptional regulator [Chloroflexota bacterium]
MTPTNSQLLVTKTRLPQLPPGWVARPRLAAKMNEALRHKLVLLSAPAGYGKTTLAVAAVRALGKPIGWVSLDAADNTPGVFLSYLVAALQSVVPGIGQPILHALQSPQPPPTDLLLTALVNSISAHEDDVVVVLDDYHLIESRAIHEAVAFLVEHLPPHAHLAITSRSDPPLPLPRWRVRGDLAEIRADDLAFTAAEAAAFFKDAAGIDLSEQDLATLARRTEGWIAGLKMAALSLKGKKDISAFINAFSGGHHYVLDYLAEEVLNRQSPDVKEFLLETSGLERLSGPLCDAVTGRSDGQSMLYQLERANLFISPLDDERRWYRYHQLFATILRNQLANAAPERVSLLHQRASAWYEQEGLSDEAISHALLGGDVERAADLLENIGSQVLRHGRAVRLLDYLSRIPQPLVEARPWLCISFAWAALLSHQWDLLSTMLARANAALAENPDRLSPISRANLRHIKGHTLSIQGYIAQAQGDIAHSIRLSEEANREIPAGDLLTRSANSINLAIDYLIIGDVGSAIRHLEDANAAGREGGNNAVVLSSQAYLAETEMQRSRLDRAAQTCREAIELGTRLGGASPLPYTALAFILLGQSLYERDDLEGAAGNLAEGIRLAEANFNWTFLLKGCLNMAKVAQARGDSTAAVEYGRQAEALAPRAPQARESRQVPAWKARLALRQGDVAAAADWARQQEATLPLSRLPSYQQEFAYLTLVRLALAIGKCQGLPAYLDAFIRNAQAQGRDASVIETLVLQALALDRLGNPGAAVEALGRALALAEPAGYVRTFVDEGAPMAGLLRKLIAAGRRVDYAARLLGVMAPQAPGRPAPPAPRKTAPDLAETLSERELEVLRLIAAGRSNKEIASRLVLAIGTVKKHTSNIFGKLGVESRTQAVARARELGLI